MYCIIHEKTIKEDDKVVAWWSFGKTVIASAVMLLVEKNILDLNKTYGPLPGTLKQVLRHDAGYPDYGGVKAYHDAVTRNEQAWDFKTLIEKTGKSQSVFQPGQGWMYSNIGYYYLTQLIKDTMNMSLQEALDQLIFDKLKVNVKVALTQEDLKSCHHVKESYDPKWVYHGLLIGTLEDACVILHTLASGELLSEDLLAEMKDACHLNIDVGDRPWKKPSYGLGLMIDQTDQSFGHTGQGPNSVIAVYHFPDKHMTVASSKNTYDQAVVENYIKSLL